MRIGFFGGGLAELAEHDDAVRAVTVHDVQRVARAYFREDVLVAGVVRGGGA